MENYAGCEKFAGVAEEWQKTCDNNPEHCFRLWRGNWGAYGLKDKRKYVHFVDGGITDNLGLRAIYEVIEVAGGVKTFLQSLDRKPPSKLIVISVNASTDPTPAMDQSNAQPSLEEAIQRVSSTQIHRYNAATLELMKNTLARWAKEVSTPEQTVKSHFIQLGFKHIDKPDFLRFVNLIPTSFRLNDEQVDKLIEAGRQLVRYSLDFQRVVAELGGTQGTGQ